MRKGKVGKVLVKLVKVLESVNINSSEAKLNKTSMSDGKGGRIKF